MAIVVIGGQASGIGKTSVVCGLIAALMDRHWTAIKITQCKHTAADSGPCDCELGDQPVAITEERDADAGTDSSRYLAAGAARSLWVRTRPGRLDEAMGHIRAEIGCSDNIILESNSVMAYLKPDFYAMVLDPTSSDFKSSAYQFVDRADAILIRQDLPQRQAPPRILAVRIQGTPEFRMESPSGCSQEFVSFVAHKLGDVGVAITGEGKCRS